MRQVTVVCHEPGDNVFAPFKESHREICWETAQGDYQTIIGGRIITVRIEDDVESIETLRKRRKGEGLNHALQTSS